MSKQKFSRSGSGNEWRVPPAGGAVRVVADATGFAYSIDLHLRVRVRKLFDLDTQRLKFNAMNLSKFATMFFFF